MARRKSVKSKLQEAKINDLRTKYRMKMAKAIKAKGQEALDLIREGNMILDKIHTIQKKSELKAKYGRENGVPDDMGIKILSKE